MKSAFYSWCMAGWRKSRSKGFLKASGGSSGLFSLTQAAVARFSPQFNCCSLEKCCGCVTAARLSYQSVALAYSCTWLYLDKAAKHLFHQPGAQLLSLLLLTNPQYWTQGTVRALTGNTQDHASCSETVLCFFDAFGFKIKTAIRYSTTALCCTVVLCQLSW